MKNKIKKVTILDTLDSKDLFDEKEAKAILGDLAPTFIKGIKSGGSKTNIKTIFLIEYENDFHETVTVDNNSIQYKELCKYVKK